MPRRTPIWSIILAPVALYLLVLLWNEALVPLHRSVWYSDTLLQWRLNSVYPQTRINAIKDVAARRAVDAALPGELVARVQTDESPQVRKAAATALGQIGSHRPLTAEAIRALSTLVLTARDDDLRTAVIGAVGQSARENRYPDQVVERIAGSLSERHLPSLYRRVATVLRQVGAAQLLPDSVFAVMGRRFADPVRPGERENLANALAKIAAAQRLPVTTLDILANALEHEQNGRIRKAIILALAHAAAHYPQSIALITAATRDPSPDVVAAAEHGLRIIEYSRDLADKDPLSLAMDTSKPVEVRLKALQVIRGRRVDPAASERIAQLAQDSETQIAVAALQIFRFLARSPEDGLDQRVLTPALTRAISHPDPLIRKAAYGALSTVSIHRPAYLRAADFPARLEAGANDPDPEVRVVALVAMRRAANGKAQQDAILERGLTDPDPYVRRMVVSWLGSPRTKTSRRQEFFAQAVADPDPEVRASAATAQQAWESRERACPANCCCILPRRVDPIGKTLVLSEATRDYRRLR